MKRSWITVWALALLAGCGAPTPERGAAGAALTPERKAPTAATREVLARVAERLPFEDDADFERARRGLIARTDPLVIATDDGGTAWDTSVYAFIEGEAPASVNPSLWRQARLNDLHGLYEVTDGIYQVRGYDLSNVTFVRGETGWIVIDPLITAETAAAALALVNEHLGERPVTALLYSHSHVDHFGGAKGVVDPADVAAGRVRVVAPEGFEHHAVSENVLAGNAMSRRASYMYGRLLPAGPQGRVDAGLGRGVSSGRVTLVSPTDTVGETGTRLVLDGVEFVFQYTPGAEAPAEMMFYLPRFRALCVAEEANATLHNLYTPRGARVRSGKLWAEWLDETLVLFGEELELVFGGHHWPRWGRAEAVDYLEKQRDLYKYIHDQTLRLANRGLTMTEIAEALELPDALAREWFNRGYYGTVNHNGKATYQLYLGWFDGNPANLHPLPPEQSAPRYVEFMGGRDAVLEKARAAFERGEYRWVAEVVNHLVFADPEDDAARWLQADALEQLGYQAESGPWRNFYLSAALELREGIEGRDAPQTGSPDIVAALTPELLFDFLAVRLNGPEAADEDLTINLTFTALERDFVLRVQHGVLNYRTDTRAEEANVGLALPKAAFLALLAGERQLSGLVADGLAEVEGNPLALRTFGGLFDRFEFWFPIVTP